MLMNEYQEKTLITAKFPPVGHVEFFYPILGMVGESGETLEKIIDLIGSQEIDPELKNSLRVEATKMVVKVTKITEKLKKVIRDKGGVIDSETKVLLCKELGDVLWYLAVLAKYIGLTLEEVAQMNIDKLMSRKARNVIHGEGDNR